MCPESVTLWGFNETFSAEKQKTVSARTQRGQEDKSRAMREVRGERWEGEAGMI